MLLQTQDAGGPRGRLQRSTRQRHRLARAELGDAQRRRELAGVVPARLAEHACSATSRSSTSPGTQAHGRSSSFIQDKWQARSERHRRPRPALGITYTPLVRASTAQGRSPTTIRPPTRSQCPATAATDNALNVKSNFKHFAPRTGVHVAPRRARSVVRARLRRQHDSVP